MNPSSEPQDLSYRLRFDMGRSGFAVEVFHREMTFAGWKELAFCNNVRRDKTQQILDWLRPLGMTLPDMNRDCLYYTNKRSVRKLIAKLIAAVGPTTK